MNGDAVIEIERLAREAAGKTIMVDGRTYSTQAATLLDEPREAEPATLALTTLEGLVGYAREDSIVAYVEEKGCFLHVESPTSVRLVTGIFGDCKQQVVLATASAVVPAIQFGQWLDPEEFNIALMAHFATGDDRATVLALTGNIRSDASVTVAEDGVSQSVTATKGVAFKTNAPVPTVVTLAPWRGFSEVERVASDFILRVRPGDASRGVSPKCALFEADAGVWRLEAIKRVKGWLKDQFKDDVAIYG